MKFGDTLVQRSVPQWRNYNVDYSTMKSHVTGFTSFSSLTSLPSSPVLEPNGETKPVSVPKGEAKLSQNPTPASLEDKLFSLLRSEHDRVGLFVRSKCYEIESRLGSIERQLSQLERRVSAATASSRPRSTLKLRQRFCRIESDILRLGNEIQNLSRFISANRLALCKLLKKHRKSTNLTSLTERFENEVLNRSDSFTQFDLADALKRYTAFLNAVREPFSDKLKQKSKTSLPEMQDIFIKHDVDDKPTSVTETRFNSELDFDLSFSRTWKEKTEEEAVFWVHNDNIVQLRVLLLQYMRCLNISGNEGAVAYQKDSVHNRQNERAGDSGAIVMYERAPPQHGGESPNSMSNPPKIARWTIDEHRTISIQTVPAENSNENDENPSVFKLESGDLSTLIRLRRFSEGSGWSSASEDSDHSTLKGNDNYDSTSLIREYLVDGPDSGPVACTFYERSRFAGLEKGYPCVELATLDENLKLISMARDESRVNSSTRGRDWTQSFPHAVLTVKVRGGGNGLLEALKRSHLTEFVPSFSFELHAYCICSKDSEIRQPPWLPKIDTNIRHVPPISDCTASIRSETQENNEHISSKGPQTPVSFQDVKTPNLTSRSGTSGSEPVTPDATTFINSMMARHDNLVTSSSQTGSRNEAERHFAEQHVSHLHGQMLESGRKYWNEYDNPGSNMGAEDEEARFIYVNPDAPLFPGQFTLSHWSNNLVNFLKSQIGSQAPDSKDAKGHRVKDTRPRTGRIIPRPSNLSSSSEENDFFDDTAIGRGEPNQTLLIPSSTPLVTKLHNKNHLDSVVPALMEQYGTFQNISQIPVVESREASLLRRDWFLTDKQTLYLGASAATLAVLTVLYHASRKSFQARGQVNAAILVGVAAALAFLLFSIRQASARQLGDESLIEDNSNPSQSRKGLIHAIAATAFCLWGGVLIVLVISA